MHHASKDDLFLCRSGNNKLRDLTLSINPVNKGLNRQLHTVEYQHGLIHDRNFNNIQSTLRESWAAAVVLRNPKVFGETIYKLTEAMAGIYLNKRSDEAFQTFIKSIQNDVGVAGQFGRISSNEIEHVLTSREHSAEMFTKKILLIKSFGCFIIDHASKDVSKYAFLFVNNHAAVGPIIQQNRPDSLFTVRGRSGVMSTSHREDIGILDSETFKRLDAKMKEILTINGLTKTRPQFRTRISHKLENGGPAFVERMFDRDNPLIASISGSTSCIFTGADVLNDKLTRKELDQLTLCAIGLFVGGGYHSVNEIINIRSPQIKYIHYIETEMRRNNLSRELDDYLAVLYSSQGIFS